MKQKYTLAMIVAVFMFSGAGIARTVRPMGNPKLVPPPSTVPAPVTAKAPPSVTHRKPPAAVPNIDSKIIQHPRSKPERKQPEQSAPPPPRI
jgi:hypothetical protein